MRLFNRGKRTIEFRGVHIAPKQAIEVDDDGAAYLLKMYIAEFSDIDDKKTVVNIPTNNVAVQAKTPPKKSWLTTKQEADAKGAASPVAQEVKVEAAKVEPLKVETPPVETEEQREEREFQEELAKEAAAKKAE